MNRRTTDRPSAGWMPVTIDEVTLYCLPHRALWIPALDTLMIADVHWGKAATFRAARIPIPTGTTAADLHRLSDALQVTAASRLVVLGDLIHHASGWHPDTAMTILAWRERHAALDITLVRGNHDRHAGDPPDDLAIRSVDGPHAIGPLLGVHEPMTVATSGYMVGGHLHPWVTLRGRGRQRMRLPAFVFGPTRGILPAFGSFTGTGMYSYETGDRLFAIAGDEVLEIPDDRTF